MKHGDSDNPQTTMQQFDKEENRAIPNAYRDEKVWQKFYNLMKSKADYDEFESADMSF